ncbi:UNVERIFIED_CONTAM: hypothetical protein PYX00_009965 [Menopon gallinae]|uniref:Endoplasmic reticulum junction formation protein lunapark n=1 Tax=Menopon gallinae TaxID=328185 RepID=A0AAW2HDF1_9NEOP
MGVIFSRFRKKSSVELLEEVEEEIKELQEDSADTERRHRKITKKLMSYSSVLCISLSVLLYFYFPSQLHTKVILIGLLMLSPVLYYVVNRIISWYYKRKIRSSHSRLNDLKKEKKRLIDEIMEKETYKVAKDILEKYAPETLPEKNAPKLMQLSRSISAVPPNPPPMPQDPRVRSQPITPFAQKNNANMALSPNPSTLSQGFQRRPPVPSQIVSGSKSYVDKLFDYIVGDGPNNRYALICSRCSTHNGMALMEEFEYTAFRCYACHIFNPARKQRPMAPKLESEKTEMEEKVSDQDSSTESSSSVDEGEGDGKAEEEKKEKPGESSPNKETKPASESTPVKPVESSIGVNYCTSVMDISKSNATRRKSGPWNGDFGKDGENKRKSHSKDDDVLTNVSHHVKGDGVDLGSVVNGKLDSEST